MKINMKQTLEEAAKEHQNGFPTCEDDSICAEDAINVISRLSLAPSGNQSNLRGSA